MHPQSESSSPDRRIDPAHPANSRPAAEPAAVPESGEYRPPDFPTADLTGAHVEDVIPRIQRWAADLDAREARLNARQATLEHHERAFRTWAQAQRQELDEQQRAAQRRHAQLSREARAVALQQWTPDTRSAMTAAVRPLPADHASIPHRRTAQQKRLAENQPLVP